MATLIRTNGHERRVLQADELDQRDYEWWSGLLDMTDDQRFVYYHGNAEFLGDYIMPAEDGDLKKWDGVMGTSAWTGNLMRYARDEWGNIDSEYVVMGTVQYTSDNI